MSYASVDEIAKLIDLGEFSDNEMMVYQNLNEEYPVEVWKIKVKSDQDAGRICDILQARKGELYNSYSGDKRVQEAILHPQYTVIQSAGGIATFISSIYLDEVKEQTNDWLK